MEATNAAMTAAWCASPLSKPAAWASCEWVKFIIDAIPVAIASASRPFPSLTPWAMMRFTIVRMYSTNCSCDRGISATRFSTCCSALLSSVPTSCPPSCVLCTTFEMICPSSWSCRFFESWKSWAL